MDIGKVISHVNRAQLGTFVVPTKAKNWMLRSELRNAHASAEGDISEHDGEHASMDQDALGSGLEPTSSDESD